MEPEDFFLVALDILAEAGGEPLTAARMCERLKVTKGSFYHHFDGMDAFMEGFAGYRETILGDLLGVAAAESDPVVRVEAAVNLIVRLPHEAEAAVRALCNGNKVLEASQRRIDRACISVAASTASAFVADADSSRCIGLQAIALIIGLQQLARPVDREQMVRALASFAERTCGLTATFVRPEDAVVSVVKFSRPVSVTTH